jgi:micrococcal nuclease
MFEYQAKLVRVIDGDTLVLDVDLGFHVSIREKFRLAGINAPEVDTAEGREAKKFIASQVDGGIIVIRTEKALKQEKYGRWLATILVGDVIINDLMVQSGHAVMYKD